MLSQLPVADARPVSGALSGSPGDPRFDPDSRPSRFGETVEFKCEPGVNATRLDTLLW